MTREDVVKVVEATAEEMGIDTMSYTDERFSAMVNRIRIKCFPVDIPLNPEAGETYNGWLVRYHECNGTGTLWSAMREDGVTLFAGTSQGLGAKIALYQIGEVGL